MSAIVTNEHKTILYNSFLVAKLNIENSVEKGATKIAKEILRETIQDLSYFVFGLLKKRNNNSALNITPKIMENFYLQSNSYKKAIRDIERGQINRDGFLKEIISDFSNRINNIYFNNKAMKNDTNNSFIEAIGAYQELYKLKRKYDSAIFFPQNKELRKKIKKALHDVKNDSLASFFEKLQRVQNQADISEASFESNNEVELIYVGLKLLSNDISEVKRGRYSYSGTQKLSKAIATQIASSKKDKSFFEALLKFVETDFLKEKRDINTDQTVSTKLKM